ncbi:type 2 isopentenyl-diphosphate Delta-isomerase [Salibacterium halotolerans]|uniref:Isopentenyl-diphosphate delta-isomerase n=1 Tax=Salibacterium halotolerans TaxID=1884432 RepID=A0A1I5Q3X1_9BACI|nr:type 2 isopentenyl-diphosphate Delta-isomerase [Salibacterium halotolerans]SFP40933.1 isopentenyl-diphosphate delta-isomerase [Salibacterium halotolerans]
MTRSERKRDHIQYALSTGMPSWNSLDDIRFVHNSLPETSVSEIDVSVINGGLALSSPFIINAMTGGGGTETEHINRSLARAAAETGAAMAVGSQMGAVKDEREWYTFETVRANHPNGRVFANLGSELTPDQAVKAVEMLKADALQIHLNVIQELVMPEGDRDFRGAIDRIKKTVQAVDVPVIVKETGFGMSAENVKALERIGVSVVDIGGHGGTNFSRIENQRRERHLSFFDEWGIPTAASIAEAASLKSTLSLTASGGIRNGVEAAKAIALGADAAALAGSVLAALKNGGREEAASFLHQCMDELKMVMTASGASTISELKTVPVVIEGKTKEWLNERGIDTKAYSQRHADR